MIALKELQLGKVNLNESWLDKSVDFGSGKEDKSSLAKSEIVKKVAITKRVPLADKLAEKFGKTLNLSQS